MTKRTPLAVEVMQYLLAAGAECQREWKERSEQNAFRESQANPTHQEQRRKLTEALNELERLAWVDNSFFTLTKPLAAVHARLLLLDVKDQDRETHAKDNIRERVPHREPVLQPLIRALAMLQALGQRPMTMCAFCEEAVLPHIPDADGMKPGDLYDRLRHWKKPPKKQQTV